MKMIDITNPIRMHSFAAKVSFQMTQLTDLVETLIALAVVSEPDSRKRTRTSVRPVNRQETIVLTQVG
jgi:hypothetical protein